MGIDWIVFGGVILFLCLLFCYSKMLYYLFRAGDDEDSEMQPGGQDKWME